MRISLHLISKPLKSPNWQRDTGCTSLVSEFLVLFCQGLEILFCQTLRNLFCHSQRGNESFQTTIPLLLVALRLILEMSHHPMALYFLPNACTWRRPDRTRPHSMKPTNPRLNAHGTILQHLKGGTMGVSGLSMHPDRLCWPPCLLMPRHRMSLHLTC